MKKNQREKWIKQGKCLSCGVEKTRENKRHCLNCSLIGRLRNKNINTKENIELCKFLLLEQKNKCAICNQIMEKPSIDHCHKTGKIRGILCQPCNLGIGYLKDDIDILKKAIIYLSK